MRNSEAALTIDVLSIFVIFFLSFFFLPPEIMVSLYSPGYSGTLQARLALKSESPLPLPPNCWESESCTTTPIFRCAIVKMNQVHFLVCLVMVFETGSHSVALGSPELVIQTKLALNSQRSACLCLLRTESKGIYHHAGSQLIELLRSLI